MVVLFLLGLIISSCGTNNIPQQSPLDTPEIHYSRGLVAIEKGDLIGAHRSFEHARLLDADYPGAYIGFALLEGEQKNYHTARQFIEKALLKDREFVDSHIALGRIIFAEGIELNRNINNWLPESLRAFDKAERLAIETDKVSWYRAQAYLAAGSLIEARKSLTSILDSNKGPWIERAMEEVERIQMVERAAPGSVYGKKIGLRSTLTRGELAVLLVEELKIRDLYEKRGPVDGIVSTRDVSRPPDIQNAWSRPWVEDVIDIGIQGLSSFPDGLFYPDQPITRAHYALVNQGILVLLSGDRALTTRYVGEESRFPDLRADHYAYNAVALSIERGIMNVDRRTGIFRPDDGVSGAEALVFIRELQNAFRFEY